MLPHTDPVAHAARRARYLEALGPAAALVVAPPHHHRNADAEYRYRQASDLFYLTGWEDPEVAALFRPGSELPFILFVQPKDPEREVWTGVREGVAGARERYGADAAFPFSELGSRLGTLLQGYASLHYRLGDDAALDESLHRALRGHAKVAARNGCALPHAFVDPGKALGEMRLLKEPAEVHLLREAGRISAEAHVLAMGAGRPGVHEYEVEAIVDGHFRRKGGNGPGYTTIVGGGNNACILHYITNREPLRDGDLCLVDAGCEYRYYTADITRTWPVNGRFSGPQRDLYEVVLAAQLAAIDCARSGRAYRDMHDVAVRCLVEGMVNLGILHGNVEENIVSEAYRRYYMHGTGHWLGLDVHDAGAYWHGFASRPLEPGMVLTVEPGLYIPAGDSLAPEAFRGIGIRIEDDVLVTTGAPDVLTRDCPKAVDEVEAACR
ncbi:MAG: aminopeptidase P N-terminal domain-containing protein [Deltaproteobacteria bacterium]|nr:aminopeptidase P N-terminal domain-containing protein [Deltaproteobacteria bacterium]